MAQYLREVKSCFSTIRKSTGLSLGKTVVERRPQVGWIHKRVTALGVQQCGRVAPMSHKPLLFHVLRAGCCGDGEVMCGPAVPVVKCVANTDGTICSLRPFSPI